MTDVQPNRGEQNYSLIVTVDNCITGIDKLIEDCGFMDNRRRVMDKCMDSELPTHLSTALPRSRLPTSSTAATTTINSESIMTMIIELSRYVFT